MHERGLGVRRDVSVALEFLIEGAQKNNSKCICKLGTQFFSGEFVAKDETKALLYYQTAAKLGDAEAQNFLGVIYLEGLCGTKKNTKKAIQLFEKSAKSQNSDSLYNLGFIYLKGKGVPQDVNAAFDYFQQGALLGHVEAANEMKGIQRMYDSESETEEK
jgi:TPR repeat protein